MQVVAVLGSPRPRASSNKLADSFLNAAGRQGAQVETFILNDLRFIGCQGCYGCKRVSEVCVIKDDLTPVLRSVEECDVLLLASPVYIADITGQMKCFIDRAFSFLTPEFQSNPANVSRLRPGKQLFFLQTQGNPDPGAFADVLPRYERFFRSLGFTTQSLIVAGVGLQENVLESRRDLVEQIEETARRLTVQP
ncbi:MAG: flavodoxin family protein [Desulfarculales bacterium]|jgi:multimeric flavodoxin WrbA|nr:flavodoxin family protein [Desulfarculales bacterium]